MRLMYSFFAVHVFPAGAADAPVFIFQEKITCTAPEVRKLQRQNLSGEKELIIIHFTHQEENLWDYWNFLF